MFEDLEEIDPDNGDTFTNWLGSLQTSGSGVTSALSTENSARSGRNSTNTTALNNLKTTLAATRAEQEAAADRLYRNTEQSAWNNYLTSVQSANTVYLGSIKTSENTYKSAVDTAESAFDTTTITAYTNYHQSIHALDTAFYAAVAAADDVNFTTTAYFTTTGANPNLPFQKTTFAAKKKTETQQASQNNEAPLEYELPPSETYRTDQIKLVVTNKYAALYYIDGGLFGHAQPRLVGTFDPETKLVRLTNGNMTTYKRIQDECDSCFTDFDEFIENEKWGTVMIWINLDNAPKKFVLSDVRNEIHKIFQKEPFEIIVNQTTTPKENFDLHDENLGLKSHYAGCYVFFSTENGNSVIAKSGMENFRTPIYTSNLWRAEYPQTGGIEEINASGYANIIVHEIFYHCILRYRVNNENSTFSSKEPSRSTLFSIPDDYMVKIRDILQP